LVFEIVPDKEGDGGDDKGDDAEGVFSQPGSEMSQLPGESVGVESGADDNVDPTGEAVYKQGKGKGFDNTDIHGLIIPW